MSEKTPKTDASPDLLKEKKKTSQLEMQDTLGKKKSNGDYKKVNDDDEDSVDIDEEELEKQMDNPDIK